MAKHTKGPFEAPGRDGDTFPVCTHKRVGKRRTVAHAYTAADAALFAAAPDLVKALEEIKRIGAIPDGDAEDRRIKRDEMWKLACDALRGAEAA